MCNAFKFSKSYLITIIFLILFLPFVCLGYDGDQILDNVQPEGGGTLDLLNIKSVTSVDDTTEATLESELDHDQVTGAGTVDTTGEVQAVAVGGNLSGTVGNATESDPTALKTAGTDNVKDTHIDWGTGAGQVSADDIPDGSTNVIITSTQETNFGTAYTHSQTTTGNPHSLDYTDIGLGANQVIDWTADQGATDIHAGNYTAGGMTYPGAGIALSTGSAWDTSITNNSGNWNTAYGWGNHASAGYLTSSTGIPVSSFTTDGGVLVGTGAGTYQEETGATLRTSLGLGTTDSPTFDGLNLTGKLTYTDTSLDTSESYKGIEIDIIKTAGASDASDTLFGLDLDLRLNQSGGTIGFSRALSVSNILTNGTISYSANGLYGGLSIASGATVSDGIGLGSSGMYYALDLQAGSTLTGNFSGVKIYTNAASNPSGGTVAGLRISAIGSYIDYGIYQDGSSALNFFEGDLTVGSGTGELTAGSINRASGSLTLEIGGTAEQTISATETTFGGNLVIPNAGYIGSASDTDSMQIEADGDVVLSQWLGIGGSPSFRLHLKGDAETTAVIEGSDAGYLILRDSGAGTNLKNIGIVSVNGFLMITELNDSYGWLDSPIYFVPASGDAWFAGDVSALTFTDRTPWYEGDALSEIMKIKGKDRKIDHSTLPEFARKQSVTKDKDGVETIEEGRDLGAMISILVKAFQEQIEINNDLQKRIDELEKSIPKQAEADDYNLNTKRRAQ